MEDSFLPKIAVCGSTIHIIVAKTDKLAVDDDFWEICHRNFPVDEVQQVKKYFHDDSKRMAFCSRLLTRLVVQNHCAAFNKTVDADEIAIERVQTKGKPLWTNSANLNVPFFHANVTHDSDLIVLAASPYLIGVDAMRVATKRNRPIPDFFESFTNVFSTSEWRFIKQAPTQRHQLKNFMTLWTMKEAYVKALGTGLYTDPGRLECIQSTTTSQWHITLDQQVQPVVFHFPPVDPDFVCTVCVAPISLSHDIYTNSLPSTLLNELKAKYDHPLPDDLDYALYNFDPTEFVSLNALPTPY